MPGNMFVPIDLLKPILADLVKGGRRAGPARPWLGVAADEVQGRLVVTRVSPDGPADRAGVQRRRHHPRRRRRKRAHATGVLPEGVGRGGAGAEIPLKLLQGVEIKEVPVVSIDRIEYFRQRTTY